MDAPKQLVAVPRPRRKFSSWSESLKGMRIVVVLLLAKVWFEHTELGVEVERVTYRFLQEHLEGSNRDLPSPVLVVDISELEPEPWKVGERWQRVTSREALRELVQAAADAGAKAIGVDIDFSPRLGRLIYPSDPRFFAVCQNLSQETSIPIRLGVFRWSSTGLSCFNSSHAIITLLPFSAVRT